MSVNGETGKMIGSESSDVNASSRENGLPKNGAKRKGRCKWFNVSKGWGFITPNEGGREVFVHQSVIQMEGFRSLSDNEEVEFECKESEKGLEATVVTGPKSEDCKGSRRRPASKKRFRKIRCYNCGELANHLAAKCTVGSLPKRCHNCKSEDHLIADCPKKHANPNYPKKTKLLSSSLKNSSCTKIRDVNCDASLNTIEKQLKTA